jgi:hypothetical protein
MAGGALPSQQYSLSPPPGEAFLALWKTGKSQLEKLLKEGQKPPKESLEGWKFRGLNVGLGAKLIRRQKFIKCFYTKDLGYGSVLTGHNFVAEQNKPEEEYLIKKRKGQDRREGFYVIEDARLNPRYQKYPHAALINYKRADNVWYEPAGLLRDYLVQPYPDNPDLLLGKAYLFIGPLEILAGFFVLERHEKMNV